MKMPRKDKKKIDKKVNKISLSLLTKNISFWFGKNAQLKTDIVLRSIIFCAMRRLYFESGLEELANRAKQQIPKADIIYKRIKRKTKEETLAEFMKTQDELLSKLRKLRLLTRKSIVLVDKTEIPYWGDKNDEGIMRTKRQRGTSHCFKYITIHALIKNMKICLHALPVTAFSNNTKLVDELLTVAKKKVRIGSVLVDREFTNSKIIPVFEKHRVKYLAPIEKNAKIKNIISANAWKKRYIHDYGFENRKETVTTIIFFIRNVNVEFDGKTPVWVGYHVFCTNLGVTDENRGILAELYRKRWNIENFYRDGKSNFLIRTKTKIFKVRLFFFLLTAMLYNLWQLVKLIMRRDITAQKWKCSVYELLCSRAKISYILTYEQKIWEKLLT